MHIATRAVLFPCIVLILAAAYPAGAQVIPGAWLLNAEVGTGLYLGEFNSIEYQGTLAPHFGLSYGASVQYNIAKSFSLLASYGHLNLPYGISSLARQKYASNFFGPDGATTYLNSTVALTPENHIAINRFVLSARSNFNADAQFVPYFTLGLGLINFAITNDSGQALPTDFTGDYERQVMVMPVGGGAEYHFNDRIAVYGQALYYVNSTDYLDGYAHYLDFEQGGESVGKSGPGSKATPPDYFATISLGVSVTLFIPDTSQPPPPPPPEPEPPTGDTTRPQPDTTATVDTAAPPPPPDTLAPDPSGDRDGDGLSDKDELERYRTDPNNPDTDGDNLSDAEEINKDNTSPNNKDTDGDGLTDGDELNVYNTNPLNRDSDGDGLRDGQEVKLYKTDPLNVDSDSDELRDGIEVTRLFTNPNLPDTDGDGLMDGEDQCPLLKGTREQRLPQGDTPESVFGADPQGWAVGRPAGGAAGGRSHRLLGHLLPCEFR